MTNTDGKRQAATAQGNAIENETREFRSPGGPENDAIVTEEETLLAEEHADGGDPCGKTS